MTIALPLDFAVLEKSNVPCTSYLASIRWMFGVCHISMRFLSLNFIYITIESIQLIC